MPFYEKSAWILCLAVLAGAILYLYAVITHSAALGHIAPPLIPTVAGFSVLVAVIAAVGHIVVAMLAPREANAPLDERESRIFWRAGSISGTVFAVGVLLALGAYLLTGSGDLLFHAVLISLIVSQLTANGLQIWFYRSVI